MQRELLFFNSFSENTEGGIAMPQKQRTSSGNIAKSLPMDIPAFMSQVRNHSTEDLEDWVSKAYIVRCFSHLCNSNLSNHSTRNFIH